MGNTPPAPCAKRVNPRIPGLGITPPAPCAKRVIIHPAAPRLIPDWASRCPTPRHTGGGENSRRCRVRSPGLDGYEQDDFGQFFDMANMAQTRGGRANALPPRNQDTASSSLIKNPGRRGRNRGNLRAGAGSWALPGGRAPARTTGSTLIYPDALSPCGLARPRGESRANEVLYQPAARPPDLRSGAVARRNSGNLRVG